METPGTNNEENMKENPPPCEKQDNSHANKDLGDPTSTAASGDSNSQSSDTLLPDDVLCDSCIENHSKAVKSCLTCLVSYCESHLRPHLENVKFQNHRLVDPLHDIECRTCEVHHLPLERFCLADGCCVCRDCESQEHDGHTSASVGEARKEIETELQKKQVEITQSVSAAEKAVGKLQSNNASIKEYSEWKKGVVDVCLPGVYVNLMDHLASFSHVVTDATQELCDQILSSYRDKLMTVCKSGTKAMAQAQMAESQPSPLPDPETREGFLKYTRSLTFDPDTTHHFLRLTEDSRKLTNTSPWQHSYPDNPGRFEYWRQAMTSESLYLGRHYIEMELSGEGAHIGVTYKSIDRKGEQNTSCITGNDFSWCLGRNRRGFSAWHAGVETPLEGTDITRIGLYVDFYQGSIAFYDVTGSITLLHKYKADFIEPLYATAWLSKKDNIVSLINANTMHNMPTPATPDC
ncbi:tripartite motif-containing protein 16-like isoform X2 [Centroberyx gerrardi]